MEGNYSAASSVKLDDDLSGYADILPGRTVLNAIRFLHTVVWAFFAGCIVVIPYFAWRQDLQTAGLLIGIFMVEVLVLLINRLRCPLTTVAARYTDQRADNFDIYLPLWVARHNKLLFGTLYASGVLYTLAHWWLTRA